MQPCLLENFSVIILKLMNMTDSHSMDLNQTPSSEMYMFMRWEISDVKFN